MDLGRSIHFLGSKGAREQTSPGDLIGHADTVMQTLQLHCIQSMTDFIVQKIGHLRDLCNNIIMGYKR